MSVSIAAFPQFLDSNGKPLSGGLVWSYAAGTTTPLTTYTSRDGDIANSNPVVLDADGRANIWLSANVAYKLVLENAPIFPATHGEIQDTVDDYYAGADPTQLQVAGVVPASGGAYTGLVNFTAGATFTGSAAQQEATLNSLGISAAKVDNLWINSDLSIAQRTTGIAADGTFSFDRVVNLAQTGNVTTSTVAQPEDGVPYAGRWLQPDATAKRMGFVQIVEAKNCLPYRGKNLVFTARVRCSIATTLRIALVSWNGAVDAPTRDVVNTWTSSTYTAGNFFVANTDTIGVNAAPVLANTFTDITVSSATAGGVVAPSSMNNLYMVVWTDAEVAQNVTLDASLLRCGLGTTAQRWTAPDAQVELARCQRYYTTSYVNQLAGTPAATVGRLVGVSTAASVGSLAIPLFLPAMRAAPTLTIYNPNTGAAGSLRNESSGADITSALIGSAGAFALVTNNATITFPSYLSAHYTASAELGV